MPSQHPDSDGLPARPFLCDPEFERLMSAHELRMREWDAKLARDRAWGKRYGPWIGRLLLVPALFFVVASTGLVIYGLWSGSIGTFDRYHSRLVSLAEDPKLFWYSIAAFSAMGAFFGWISVACLKQATWLRDNRPKPSIERTAAGRTGVVRASQFPEAAPIADSERPQAFANAAAALRTSAVAEPDATTKAELLASAATFEKLDAESRKLHAQAEAAKAAAKALEPGPVRLVAHFVLVSALALLLSVLMLKSSLASWGTPSYLWPAIGLLAGGAFSLTAAHVGLKALAPQGERLRFARLLPRWLAPVRGSLLMIFYALALLIAVVLVRVHYGS